MARVDWGKVDWATGAKGRLRIGVGYGILNMVLYAEDRMKAEAPVRGGHRSFLTGSHLGGPLGIKDTPGTKRAKPTVGGTLRRSIYSDVFVQGESLAGRSVDGNQEPIQYDDTGGAHVVAIVGTNSGYGGWVDQGTSKMPARPFTVPALQLMAANAAGLFDAGSSKYWSKYP